MKGYERYYNRRPGTQKNIGAVRAVDNLNLKIKRGECSVSWDQKGRKNKGHSMMVTFGVGWNEIAYQVGCVVPLTMILFIIGVLLFSRN